jgi:hypothetical protein
MVRRNPALVPLLVNLDFIHTYSLRLWKECQGRTMGAYMMRKSIEEYGKRKKTYPQWLSTGRK